MWQFGVLAALLCMASADKIKLDQLDKPITVHYNSFKENVLVAALPYVIAFHEGADSIPESVYEAAKEVEGLVFIGTLDLERESEVLELLELRGEVPNFVVYPAGKKSLKTRPKAFDDIAEAVAAARETIPSDLVYTLRNEGDVQPFLTATLQQGFLPALFFVEKPEVPIMVTKVSVWMYDVVRIAIFPNAPESVRKSMQAPTVPHLIVLVPQDDEQGNVQFASAPYSKQKFGAYKFTNVLKFFMGAVQEVTSSGMWKPGKYKPGGKDVDEDDLDDVPPPPPAPKPSTSSQNKPNKIFEISSKGEYCSSSYLGLCIVAILDGAPENTEKEAQLALLSQTQHASVNKGRPLQFMWIDAPCHPSFINALDVQVENAPTVVAIVPRKGRVAKMRGSFTENSINSFIANVLNGKEPSFEIGKLPQVPVSEDCVAFHEANKPIIDEPLDDLDDFMKEVIEESEQKRKDAETVQPKDEDYELREKKRKAQEEVERLNKLNKPKKKTKKAPAKKAKKTEL